LLAPDPDRQRVLRSYRRIIYDAHESSSPVSNLELIEKYGEKRLDARENLTLEVNFSALKQLARWDFWGYPQTYPTIERTGAISAGTAC
jgi:hypothetical protein